MAFVNQNLDRFFAVSLALHGLAFLLFYAPRPVPRPIQEMIPVSVLPVPQKAELSPSAGVPSAAPTRPTKTKTIVARKESPAPFQGRAKNRGPTVKPPPDREAVTASLAPPATPAPPPAPAPLEAARENTAVVERELPTVRELLPSANWSSSRSRGGAPVSLNTKDPVYVSYFNKIKQSIELQWEYPEVALRYGLQGRLSLEFAIAPNGQLERLRILRSSGSQVLDGEALRAIQAAAPFPPIPPWIKANPLLISASMEYHDNRVNYQFAP